jgi:hypothetical protein
MKLLPHAQSYITRISFRLTVESLCLFARNVICDHKHRTNPTFFPMFLRIHYVDAELSERHT